MNTDDGKVVTEDGGKENAVESTEEVEKSEEGSETIGAFATVEEELEAIKQHLVQTEEELTLANQKTVAIADELQEVSANLKVAEAQADRTTGRKRMIKRARIVRCDRIIASLQECFTGLGQEKKNAIEATLRKHLDNVLRQLSL